ncbi:hypothetical protein ACFOWM_13880 [Ferruginibacter yonginensis]|uniref:YD repeat-containing protein n=1 Tax=Ferruginibacter yonginensis TaxID=1310416 RepID=A0ABV8QUP2_9BACT
MRKNFIILTAVSLILFSCQKENSIENGTNTIIVNTNADTLLKKFIVLDTTIAAPNDTVYKYTFAYDNLKRCTSYRASDGIDSFVIYNFFNGSDPNITHMKIYNLSSGDDSTFNYFTYSQTGKILTDSIIEYNPTGTAIFLLNYQNTTNQGGIITDISNGTQFEINKFSSLRDNGNIINIKDSLFRLIVTNYTLSVSANADISYDNKINPFYRIVPKHLVNVLLESSSIFTFPPFQSLPQKNNILMETKIFSPQNSGLDNYNNSLQYVYNSNNYPLIVRVRDLVNNKYYKGIYIY